MRAAAHTRMFQEAASAALAVRTQLLQDAAQLHTIAARIRTLAPRAVITCARGSSDHAATYAKYLIETHARVLTASAAPSVSSVYGITQDLEGCLFIAISQSGQSPDLLAAVARARAAGATVLALCNSAASPLVAAADLAWRCAPVPRPAVAATKSFLATLAALARLVAAWTQDAALAAGARGIAGADGGELGARLVGGGRAVAAGRATCTSSAAASGWAPRRKSRSSSRRPAACMPRPSAAPR